MNKYGYFVYENFPINAEAEAYPNFGAQTGSEDIISIENEDAVRRQYFNFASFEEGEFDFEKPIFINNPNMKMAYTSVDTFIDNHRIDIEPEEAYSGAGITLRTFNNDYIIYITVTDLDGTRTERFDKTEDEFYPMIFNGLISVRIQFAEVEPNHFLKVVGFRLGTIRILSENDFVELPTITNHFSLTNEELGYDTLDLLIRGNKENFNVIEGERITYSETGQRFYVAEAIQNSNDTISISAYDDISRFEKNFIGIMRSNESTEDTAEWLAKGKNNDIEVDVLSTLYGNQVYSGTISNQDTYREALRTFLQGNGIALRRTSNGVELFCPYNPQGFAYYFNIHNLIDVPEADNLEQYGRIHFSKHIYKVNRKDDREVIYRGTLPTYDSQDPDTVFTIRYDDPHDSILFYRVTGTDQQGEDILELINVNDPLSPIVIQNAGAYYRTGKYDGQYEEQGEPPTIFVVAGYPYNTSYYGIDTNVNVPVNFKDNEKNISDCTVLLEASNYNYFREYLRYIYSFYYKLSFSSLLNAEVGHLGDVNYDGNQYYGWIITKKSNLNGVYEYEMICRKGVA